MAKLPFEIQLFQDVDKLISGQRKKHPPAENIPEWLTFVTLINGKCKKEILPRIAGSMSGQNS